MDSDQLDFETYEHEELCDLLDKYPPFIDEPSGIDTYAYDEFIRKIEDGYYDTKIFPDDLFEIED